jgi:hypothetical protein
MYQLLLGRGVSTCFKGVDKWFPWLAKNETILPVHVVRMKTTLNIILATVRTWNLTFLTMFLPTKLLVVCGGICQKALMSESGMIRTQMRTHTRSEHGRSVWDALYNNPPPPMVTSNGISCEVKGFRMSHNALKKVCKGHNMTHHA